MLGGISDATVGRRITAEAKAAGVEVRITSHSGRVELATELAIELTSRGASLQEIMLVGNWSTARMVACYSAEANAVVKYL